jgi:hypothetical protein
MDGQVAMRVTPTWETCVVRGYDVIGDVHGCADKLEGLLLKLGYAEGHGAYRYSGPEEERQVIFVGDLIDRGDQQTKTLDLARAMVEAGSAQMVMGNHEFNAISFATSDPDHPGEYMRPHEEKNLKQHEAFIEEIPIGTPLYAEWIGWFLTLPLWLDLDGIRVVHACWNAAEIDKLKQWVPPGEPMSTDFVVGANRKGSPQHQAIEVLLKGPELNLTKYGQPSFKDKEGNERDHARIRWWNSEGRTLRDLAEILPHSRTPDGDPYPELPDDACQLGTAYAYRDPVPVFYGHYWRTGSPRRGEDWTNNTVCVDFSAGKGGPLMAYRWNYGAEVSGEHFESYG